MRAKYFSTTVLTVAVLLAGLIGVVNLQSSAVYAQEEDVQQTEEQQVEQAQDNSDEPQSEETTAQDISIPQDYSYTVQPGDGVTHMILDLASVVGVELSPSQAYDIARSTGSIFLEENLTTESDAPFTDGIGGLPQPGETVTVNAYPTVFESVSAGTSSVARGETPEPAEGTEDLSSQEDNQNDASDAEDDNEESASEDNGLSPLAIILGTLGVAAVAYYLFGRSNQ